VNFSHLARGREDCVILCMDEEEEMVVRRAVPSLQQVCIVAIGKRPRTLEEPGVLEAVGEDLSLLLLGEVIRRTALTPTLLRRFRAAGHRLVLRTLSEFDEGLGYIGPPPSRPGPS
jgi:hypothetical protein